MSDFTVPATDTSPLVEFHGSAGTLTIRGESYSEDAAASLGKVVGLVRDEWTGAAGRSIRVVLAFVYFNSSSARKIVALLDTLDEVGGSGAKVEIAWTCRPADESCVEFGEEFGEDLENVSFSVAEEA